MQGAVKGMRSDGMLQGADKGMSSDGMLQRADDSMGKVGDASWNRLSECFPAEHSALMTSIQSNGLEKGTRSYRERNWQRQSVKRWTG